MVKYVKKIMVFSLIVFSCIGLMGASIWEGSAAMAAGGELPETGYYIATNSFPRNTVVDVMNLENGKTLRAIVVSGIDTPGLLGILSKDAAAALHLDKGIVGRIRVNMPADPIAFSRYTDELVKNGDPDRDPVAAISLIKTEEAPVAIQEKSAEPTEEDTSKAPIATETDVIAIQPIGTEETPLQSIFGDEQNITLQETVDENIQELPELAQDSSKEDSLSDLDVVPENGLVIAETPDVISEVSPEASAEALAEEVPEAPSAATDFEIPAAPEVAAEAPDSLEPEAPEVAVTEMEPAELAVSTEKTQPEASDVEDSLVELSLEPAEERPPVSGLAETVAPPDVAPPDKTDAIVEIPEAHTIEVQAEMPEAANIDIGVEAAIASEAMPAIAPEPEPVLSHTPVETEKIEAPVGPVKITQSEAILQVTGDIHFSVPVVTSLVKGTFYIQLGAFYKADAVEHQIKKLNNNYPLLVQVTGSTEKPLYRLLIGPLNEGESGALVSYFKKSGYKDAFVKKEI